MLVDHQIELAIRMRHLKIEPWNPKLLQPASVDFTLDKFFRVYDMDKTGDIDPKSRRRRTRLTVIEETDSFRLEPLQFALGSTAERVTIPGDMIGRIEGKSSVARMGLFVHVTAGFMDPGFEGWTTLEFFNAAPFPILLYPGMPIAQMSFDYSARTTDTQTGRQYHPVARNPYQGKYQAQAQGPQESRYWKNFQ